MKLLPLGKFSLEALESLGVDLLPLKKLNRELKRPHRVFFKLVEVFRRKARDVAAIVHGHKLALRPANNVEPLELRGEERNAVDNVRGHMWL